MKLIKLLYIKYFVSFSICLVSSFIIFFIFSLLANLNEDYFFNTIINVSLLNSIQIIVYVPAFIFLISVILFTIFLRSRNEIVIIKSYLKMKKLLLFFLPIVIIFAILEINKKDISLILEINKDKLIDEFNEPVSKILIKNENESKTFTVLKNISNESLESTEFREYKVFNNKIYEAKYSDSLITFNNTLIAKNYTHYAENLIEEFEIQKIIKINFSDLINQRSVIKDILEKNDILINIKLINLLIFFILFFYFIFLIFFNKKFVNVKENLLSPIFICMVLLLYSFFIFNNSLTIFRQEFELLASMIIGISILRLVLNE